MDLSCFPIQSLIQSLRQPLVPSQSSIPSCLFFTLKNGSYYWYQLLAQLSLHYSPVGTKETGSQADLLYRERVFLQGKLAQWCSPRWCKAFYLEPLRLSVSLKSQPGRCQRTSQGGSRKYERTFAMCQVRNYQQLFSLSCAKHPLESPEKEIMAANSSFQQHARLKNGCIVTLHG